MLTALLLGAQMTFGVMNQAGASAILTYSSKHSDEAHWSARPTAADISATGAASLAGGSRASLKCSADKQGSVIDCEIVAAEPDRQEVRISALKMASLYHLNNDDTEKVKWSQTTPVIWLQIIFPDKRGMVPNDCHPAFGCVMEPGPPPPPPASTGN